MEIVSCSWQFDALRCTNLQPCCENNPNDPEYRIIRIRIILFWINRYEYNLCYNDTYIHINIIVE